MNRIKVTLKKSPIGYSESTKRTVEALGLHKLQKVKIHDDNRVIRGMIKKVIHLLSVEKLEEVG